MRGPLCCACRGDLLSDPFTQVLGVSLATTSHQLKELRRAGVITMHRRGRNVYCAINGKAMQALAGVVASFAPNLSLLEAANA